MNEASERASERKEKKNIDREMEIILIFFYVSFLFEIHVERDPNEEIESL